MPESEVIVQRTPEEEEAYQLTLAKENIEDVIKNLTRIMGILDTVRNQYMGKEIGRLCAITYTSTQQIRSVVFTEIYMIQVEGLKPFDEARG